jgi:UDP-3-O-[3-hydroxymyristoyl] glucosamine N-acyltransferase
MGVAVGSGVSVGIGVSVGSGVSVGGKSVAVGSGVEVGAIVALAVGVGIGSSSPHPITNKATKTKNIKLNRRMSGSLNTLLGNQQKS